ncbi:uncharacterized protein LOC144701652 isoform X2 [Wolffia australiana]
MGEEGKFVDGKVKLEVCAGLWIDPLDFLPLNARKAILQTGRQPNWLAEFPRSDIDFAANEAFPRFFLGIFSQELARALNCANQEFSGPNFWDKLLDESSSREKKFDDAPNINGGINSEGNAFHISVKVKEISRFKECTHQKRLTLHTLSCPAETRNERDANLTEENLLNVVQQEQHSNLRPKVLTTDGEIESARDCIENIPEDPSPNIADKIRDSAATSVSVIIKKEPCDEDLDDRSLHSLEKILSESRGKNIKGSHVTSSRDDFCGENCQKDGPFRNPDVDSALFACDWTVKDEQLEGNDFTFAYESNAKKHSRCSASDTADEEVAVNSNEDAHSPTSSSGRNALNSDEHRLISTPEIDIPTDENSFLKQMQTFASSCLEETQGSRSDSLKDLSCKSNFMHFGSPFSGISEFQVKYEVDETPADDLDVIPLSERFKLLTAKKLRFNQWTEEHGEEDRDPAGSGFNYETSARRRKRKKTATDLVEVALEEDAPGLLQIFSERSHSLGKLNIKRHWKGDKASYCLSCLLSLIEQTRYLRFRKYPVEWGWCRDIQSFIFVFEMHNRIVLERPEYGYATYFFELVASHAIDWQIRRLVIAMKLPSCSRTTLIENKPLMVGADVTEGEARVLEEYGWMRNSGLGTMLNYCDRVVHDRRHERRISDWRLKIGKLLMDGYDGGRIIHTGTDNQAPNHCTEVKLET